TPPPDRRFLCCFVMSRHAVLRAGGTPSRNQASPQDVSATLDVEIDGDGEVQFALRHRVRRQRQGTGTPRKVDGLLVEQGEAGAVDDPPVEDLPTAVDADAEQDAILLAPSLRKRRIALVLLQMGEH